MADEERKPVTVFELYANEIAALNAMVQKDAWLCKHGTWSERNPMAGKMRRCICGRRSRFFGETCCGAKVTEPVAPDRVPVLFATLNKWAWNDETKEFEFTQPDEPKLPHSMVAKRRKHPRLTRNRPPLFEMHQMIREWEKEIDKEGNCTLVTPRRLQDEIEGLAHFWTPQNPIQMAGLASFSEKLITRKRKARARLKRQQRDRARRINQLAT